MVWVLFRDKKINRTDLYKNFIFDKVALQTIEGRTNYLTNECAAMTKQNYFEQNKQTLISHLCWTALVCPSSHILHPSTP